MTALVAVAGCKGLLPARGPDAASVTNEKVGKTPADSKPHALSMLDGPTREVVSFVSKNCLECHSAKDPEGDLVLAKFTDALSIRKDRKVWTKALTLVSGGSMPPDDATNNPSKEQRDAFVAAAKKVLEYYDPSRPDPGRITLRRLNRTEYDNSVYDLTQVKSFPSKEFPRDDISGGYDNNADGLTLSPLLTERYLLAADAILQQLLPENGRYAQVSRMDTWPVPAARSCKTAKAET